MTSGSWPSPVSRVGSLAIAQMQRRGLTDGDDESAGGLKCRGVEISMRTNLA